MIPGNLIGFWPGLYKNALMPGVVFMPLLHLIPAGIADRILNSYGGLYKKFQRFFGKDYFHCTVHCYLLESPEHQLIKSWKRYGYLR